jgi:hypothetical protein
MRKKILIFGATLSVLGLAVGIAHAAVTQIVLRTEAQVCVGADTINEWGAINTSTAVETVICPVTTSEIGAVEKVQVRVWDRSAIASANGITTCTLLRKDSTGNVFTFGTPQSPTVTQSANVITLTWNNPPSGQGLVVRCAVPARFDDSISGVFSGVSSITATYFAQP